MVRREYLSSICSDACRNDECFNWEALYLLGNYTLMSSIKNVNCILLWVGAEYSNYYYLLFLAPSVLHLVILMDVFQLEEELFVIFIFPKRHLFVWLTF